MRSFVSTIVGIVAISGIIVLYATYPPEDGHCEAALEAHENTRTDVTKKSHKRIRKGHEKEIKAILGVEKIPLGEWFSISQMVQPKKYVKSLSMMRTKAHTAGDEKLANAIDEACKPYLDTSYLSANVD